MAATGRDTPGERDKPHMDNVITATGEGADTPKSIGNAITAPKALGQIAGQTEPPIGNVITCPGPNK
jgi:hypothetical protein